MCYAGNCQPECDNCKPKYLKCPACGTRALLTYYACPSCGHDITEEMRESAKELWQKTHYYSPSKAVTTATPVTPAPPCHSREGGNP